MFGLALHVYMVQVSYQQKPFCRSMMQTWGAEVLASPTDQIESGRRILAQDPGSLGIAMSEAVEDPGPCERAPHVQSRSALPCRRP